MDNYIGHRAKVGVIIPSTNTAVEYDLLKFLPRGLTWHPSRFWVEQPTLNSDEEFLSFLELIRSEIPLSIRDVMTCNPTHIMMGMSAETFWGGLQGNEAFIDRVREQIGDLGLTTGANACAEALKAFNARSIAVLTPYQEVGDKQVESFFREIGYDVKAVKGLRCPTATSIADTPEQVVIDAVKEIDADDVDAIVQVGTNLSTLDLFPTVEKWLGKPCLPINAVTIWHALRHSGINDQFDGLGKLFEEH